MPDFAIAIFIRPFVFLVVTLTILLPAKYLTGRYMKEGPLKRLLLSRIGE